jgi:hypothetical protein
MRARKIAEETLSSSRIVPVPAGFIKGLHIKIRGLRDKAILVGDSCPVARLDNIIIRYKGAVIQTINPLGMSFYNSYFSGIPIMNELIDPEDTFFYMLNLYIPFHMPHDENAIFLEQDNLMQVELPEFTDYHDTGGAICFVYVEEGLYEQKYIYQIDKKQVTLTGSDRLIVPILTTDFLLWSEYKLGAEFLPQDADPNQFFKETEMIGTYSNELVIRGKLMDLTNFSSAVNFGSRTVFAQDNYPSINNNMVWDVAIAINFADSLEEVASSCCIDLLAGSNDLAKILHYSSYSLKECIQEGDLSSKLLRAKLEMRATNTARFIKAIL